MAEQPETATSRIHQSFSAPNSAQETLKHSWIPAFSTFPGYPSTDFQMLPIMYRTLVPGLNPLQNQEQTNHGAGIYAVPVPPYMGPIAGLPSNTLIPLTFNVPPVDRVLRLGQLVLMGKGTNSSSLVLKGKLLYQTGALTPLVRWLSQSMQRAAAPPRPPRAAVRAENAPASARQNENAALAEGHAGAENENQPAEDGNHATENENAAERGDNGGNHRWGIVKEIQMIVLGFITSLLPGLHNIDHI